MSISPRFLAVLLFNFFNLNPSLFNWLEFPSPRGAVSELPQDHRKPQQLHADSAQFPQHCPLHGHSSRNIAHYMEVYTIVYHILHQPHRFPHVSAHIAWHVDRQHLLPHDGEPEDLSLDPALQGHRALPPPPREPIRQRLPRAHDRNRRRRNALLPPSGFHVSTI